MVASLLAAVIWQTDALAADAKGNFTVLSMGTKSCGTVVSDYEKDEWPKIVNSVWVGGFLTAINAEVHKGENVAQGTDPAARDLWIYNYCKANPLDTLYRATNELWGELRRRTR